MAFQPLLAKCETSLQEWCHIFDGQFFWITFWLIRKRLCLLYIQFIEAQYLFETFTCCLFKIEAINKYSCKIFWSRILQLILQLIEIFLKWITFWLIGKRLCLLHIQFIESQYLFETFTCCLFKIEAINKYSCKIFWSRILQLIRKIRTS